MSPRVESIVLVEGYDDRDFWKGLLTRCACTEARNEPPARHRQSPAFTYLAPSGTLIHVLPFMAARPGSSQGSDLASVIRVKLKERLNKPLRRLVLSPDADTHATLEDAQKSVRAIISSACRDAIETPEGDFLVDGGKLIVSALFVHGATTLDDRGPLASGTAASRVGAAAPEEVLRDDRGQRSPGTPEQRALEQLACAALCSTYPERGRAVARWLADRPAPHGKEHKAHAWSFYAGWYTDHGPGDFYGSLWKDDRVAVELERLLREQGAWRVIESLLRD